MSIGSFYRAMKRLDYLDWESRITTEIRSLHDTQHKEPILICTENIPLDNHVDPRDSEDLKLVLVSPSLAYGS